MKEIGRKVENWIKLKILFLKIQWHSDEFMGIEEYSKLLLLRIQLVNSSKFKRIEGILLNSKVFDDRTEKIQVFI